MRCETINPADGKYCYKCSMALTQEAAVELGHTDNLMNRLLEDPEVSELFRRKLAEMKAH